MKTKHFLNKIATVAVLVTLFSGFQMSNNNGTMSNLESAIGIEEAYAGACNDNGCVGGDDRCMEVSILWGAFTRVCTTTVPQNMQ